MKGIIAKGIELPRCCDVCDMRRIYSRMKPCPCPAVSSSLVRHASDAIERREGCPLTELLDNEAAPVKTYEDGIKAGIIQERSNMYSRCYPEIARYLDRQGIDNPEEEAEYICQIIKGFTAQEIEDILSGTDEEGQGGTPCR